MGSLEQKVSVITGGASGIGASTTRLFAQEGSQVVVADILDGRGEALAAELGSNVIYAHADVTSESDIENVIRLAVDSFGQLDCLFNNAGIGGVNCPIADTPAEDMDHTMSVLFRAVVLGIKHAAPFMKQNGKGSIINTASVAGLRTGLGPHIYSAAKAAIIHLTRSVAMELAEHKVRVNSICPGGIATPIFGTSLGLSQDEAEQKLPIVENIMAATLPLGRSGTPEDVAQVALWLASDSSSFVTGHSLVVDSGITCGRTWSETQAMWDGFRAALGIQPSD